MREIALEPLACLANACDVSPRHEERALERAAIAVRPAMRADARHRLAEARIDVGGLRGAVQRAEVVGAAGEVAAVRSRPRLRCGDLQRHLDVVAVRLE